MQMPAPFLRNPCCDRHQNARPFVLRRIAYCVMLACSEGALANPVVPQVVNGAASFARPDARTLNVTNSPGTIINWQGFSIGAGELTRFTQQSPASAVLNRVIGADISKIQGQLLSNGRVFLINPAGIAIGAGAVIDTAGFVGSTLNMSNADFLAGKLKFEGGASAGSIVNQGWIKAGQGGNVVLVAPNIENSGVIQTEGGQIVLAAGQKMTIGSLDLEGVQFEIQAPADSVLNLGKLLADGGAVGVFAGTLRHSGDIRANALTRDEAGRIVLKAQGDVTLAAGSATSADGKRGGDVTIHSTSGTTLVSGDISAKGSEGRGGIVRILGNLVGVLARAVVDASGNKGGGEILVGGDFRGKNEKVHNAWRTLVAPQAALRADAGASGNGGKVIVWADDATRYYGAISARGGAQSGNGGLVEVSGKHFLGFNGTVDTRAPNGALGTLLLDPTTINIVPDPAGPDIVEEFDFLGSFGNTRAFFEGSTSLTDVSELAISRLRSALNLAQVIITTESTAAGGGDIHFDAPLNISGIGGPKYLSLLADRHIDINSAISGATASDTLNLLLHANRTPALNGVITIGANIDLGGGLLDASSAGSGIVNMSGTPTISNVSSFDVRTLNIGTATASINAPASVGTLTLGSGGTLGGTGTVTVSGVTTWTGGTMSGPGTTIAAGGLTVSGPATKNLTDGRTLSNTGTATWTNGAAFSGRISTGGVTSGATISNSGLWQDQTNNGAISNDFGSVTTFTNTNTYTKSGVGTTGIGANVVFNNTGGTVNVNNGALQLSGGGTSTGTFSVPLNGGLHFDSTTYDVTAAGSISGAGNVLFTGGTTNIAGTYAITGLTDITTGVANFNNSTTPATTAGGSLSGGALGGSGAFTVNNGGTFDWSGGSLDGTGTLNIAPGANLTITSNPPSRLISGGYHIDNSGTVTWSSGVVGVVSGASTIVNHALWRMQGNSSLDTATSGGGTMTFTNAGGATLTKDGGGTSGFLNLTALNNIGAVNVTDGTFILGGGGTSTGTFSISNLTTLDLRGGNHALSGPITNSGTLVNSGATTNFSGAYSEPALSGIAISAGTFNANSAMSTRSLVLSGGELAGSNVFTISPSGTATLGNGSLLGNTFNVSSGATVDITTTTFNASFLRPVTFNNSGIVNWTAASAGIRTPSGVTTFNNQSGGQFNILGATTWDVCCSGGSLIFNNLAGATLTKSSGGSSVLDTGVTFNNANAVSVTAGRLALAGGGTSTGAFTIGNGATLDFSGGTHTVSGPITNSAGTLVNSGALTTFSGAYSEPVAAALTISGGTFTANSAMSSNSLTLSDGILTGSSAFTLPTGGSATLGNGTLAINTFNTSPGSTTNITTTSFTSRFLEPGTFNNSGIVNWTAASSGIRTPGSLSTFNNQSGGQFNILGAGTWDVCCSGGSVVFNNQAGATLTKSSGGTSVFDTGVTFNNSNAVNVTAGRLAFGGGGTSTGPFSIGSTATLDFSGGTHTLSGAITNSAGTLANSGATTTFTGAYSEPLAAAVAISGGTFNANTVVNTDSLTISSGTFNASTAMTSRTLHLSGGNLTGSNVFTLPTGGSATLGNGSLLINTFNVSSGATVDITTTAFNAAFLQPGTFNNSGIVNWTVASAGIRTPGALSTFNNQLGGQFNILGAATWDICCSGGSVVFNNQAGATLTKSGAGSSVFDTGVALNNSGTLAVTAGSLTLNQNLTNNGAITLKGTGATHSLLVNGDLTFAANSTLNTEVAGTGVGQFGNIAATGTTTISIDNTRLNITGAGGYTPVIGDTFPVLMTSAVSGVFREVTNPFTNDVTMAYDPTSVQFTIGGGPANAWVNNDGDWSIGGNWSRGHVPGPTEPVSINRPAGQFTITVPAGSFTAGSLASSENITLAGGTLTLANASTIDGALAINSGTLQGAGPLTVNGGMTWTGGTIANTGGVTIPGTTTINAGGNPQLGGPLSTGVLNMNAASLGITGAGILTLTGPGTSQIINSTITNAGIVRYNTAGNDLLIGNGSVFNNQAGGTFDIQGDIFVRGAGNGVFNNAGTLLKTGGSGTDPGGFDATLPFNNNGGLLNSVSGALELTGGGTHSGRLFTAGNGVNLNGGTHTMAAGSSFDGPFIFLNNGAVLDVSGNPTINTSLVWNGPSTITNGNLTVAPAGVLAIVGLGSRTLSGATLTNAGTTTVAFGGDLTLNNGAVLANNGTLDLQGNSGIQHGAGAGAILNNSGVLTRTAGGTSVIGNGITLDNAATGRIDVRDGTLQVNGAFPNNPGAINVSAGAIFSTNGAALTNTGMIAGNGTIDLSGARLTNSGTVAPGASPGMLTINGDYMQTPTGVLAVDLAGTTQGVTYDLLQITGVANLAGTVASTTSGGFVPVAGDTFNFMTYARRVGDFTAFNLPAGSGLQAAPAPTLYALAVATPGNVPPNVTPTPAPAPATNNTPNPTGVSTQSARDLPTTETQRLTEQFFDLVTSRNTEDEPKRLGANVCR